MNKKLLAPEVAGSSIGESIYLSLRKAIIELDLKPGESLSIKDIAEQLGVSRSPVRDSIIKLGKEGLVDIIPQSGTSVSKIDLNRVEEEQFIRSSLEEKALLLFIEACTPNHIVQLEGLIQSQYESLVNKEYATFLDYDDAFHSVFFQVANKRMAWNLIENMSGHYRRLRLIISWETVIAEDVINEHQKLLQYIKEKNIEKIKKSIKEHIMRIFTQENQMVEKYPSYFKENGERESLFKNLKS